MMTMFIDIIDVHSTSWPAVKEIHLDVALGTQILVHVFVVNVILIHFGLPRFTGVAK